MNEIKYLIDGFKQFQLDYQSDVDGKFSKLSQYGAHSKILMIACCDSRVDPAIITHAETGDLMVIRNMANIVPPFQQDSAYQETQAAIQFAVCYLNIEQIIVMGHSRCGGVRSLLTRLMDRVDAEQALDKWTALLEPTAKQVLNDMPHDSLDEQSCCCSRRSIICSLDRLKAYPWVKDKLKHGKMTLHGWYFNLANGQLENYNSERQQFETLY